MVDCEKNVRCTVRKGLEILCTSRDSGNVTIHRNYNEYLW